MSQLLLSLVMFVSSCQVAAGIKTHFVFWNTTNPIFRLDNTDNVIDVNVDNLPWEYDQLNLICPRNVAEQHVIYSVSQEDFDTCRVSDQRPKIIAICNQPEKFQYFTITFRNFSPTPGGLEFKPGQTYYLISTSTSRDIHRRVGGYCSSHNMKMTFRVADNTEETQTQDNLVQINLNEPRKVPVSLRQEPQYPRVWSARVPQHRNDYIYYYKPWAQQSYSSRVEKQSAVKYQELNNNEILTALPFTSSSSPALSRAATVVILISVFVSKLIN